MENQDIDKMFSDAGKSAEENPKFPSFEKVWKDVEEKLDKKEEKKRIIPLWLPYGIAAGLALTFGVLYIMKDDKVKIKPQISQNTIEKSSNSNTIETPKRVEEINKTFEDNIKKNPINTSENVNGIIAYHDGENRKDKLDNIIFKKKEKPQSDELIIKNENIETPPPPISRKLETSGMVENYVYEEIKAAESVVAMGIKRDEKSSAYSIEKERVVAEASKKKTIYPYASPLVGIAPGVNISPSIGFPASSPTVMIRGISSYDKSNQPLYVIDGKIESSKILTSMNPNIIADIKVLKNESATALYGSRGKNGVIVINTKDLSEKEKKRLNKEFKRDSDKNLEKFQLEEEKLPEAGKLTAGEVNDFSKWNYWQDIAVPILDQYKKTWKFFPDRRVSVQLTNFDNNPIIGKKLKLIDDKKEIIWESVTDNRGNAELWISSLVDQKVTSQQYSIIDEDGNLLSNNAKEFRNGQNIIKINANCIKKRALDLVFVVDATGSMGDEINYLKSELLDVLKKVESNLKNTNVRYGSVFYRDNGDEYVTRKFDFSNNAENLINFIKNQNANGGGDTPEAVVEALETSIDKLAWSNENSTKLMFLLLDAPPHLTDENIEKLYQKIKLASKKGITIIPIAASDTDKQTEYLMRTFALLTNGTYTFLTNDSGIGNDHIKPTASEYEVEKLNDLLLRLVLQRSTLPDCKNGVTNEYINKKLEVESLVKKDFATKIFPNPTKGVFKIDTKRDIEEFTLYDYAGKILIKKNNLIKGSNTFDISNYPQSIYLVRLKYGTESETFKIIKN